MKKETEKIPHAEPPVEFTKLKLTKPKTVAAGFPAVVSSLKHIQADPGLARGLKALSKLNQKGGIDCPSCAWPDPDDDRSAIGEYCENGAKAIAEEATTKSLTAKFFQENSVYDLSLLSDYEIGKKGRIAQPMYLPEGGKHYEEISWEKAFEKIGKSLNSLQNPDEAIFYTSGRTSNEAAFLYQLFVREFGTNNLPDCSNMCHESSGVALTETLGIGKGSVRLEDFYHTDLILILGQNPGTNHPRMLSALKKAKENGATIISINPLVETGLVAFANPQEVKGMFNVGTDLTDLYLQVKINGDMALLKAAMLRLSELEAENPNSIFDYEFIANKTNGLDSFLENLKSYNFEELVIESGVSKEEIEKFVSILANKKNVIACWAMGLTQHKNAVETIQDVVNLLLLKGSIGKPFAGTCPVRGHSNVQGDRTMGIYEKPSEEFLVSLENNFKFTLPRKHGFDVVESIHAMHQKVGKVFFCMGGNFLSASPDTNFTAQALRNCGLTVHVSTKLNRSHLIHGKEAIILPCLARTDLDMKNGENQFVTVENSMGVVQSSRGNLKPISTNLLSEVEIVCRLATETLKGKSKVDWKKFSNSYDEIRNEIEKCIPGFENFNQRVRVKGGFYLPNGSRFNDYKTLSGKAHFTTSKLTKIDLKCEEFLMMTIRTHDQFNTTIYGLDDRYRGILNERRVVLMNKNDMLRFNFKQEEIVDLFNFDDGVERVAEKFKVIEYNIPEKCLATYFPETNVLVPINSAAKKSNTPTSKSVVVEVRKVKSLVS